MCGTAGRIKPVACSGVLLRPGREEGMVMLQVVDIIAASLGLPINASTCAGRESGYMQWSRMQGCRWDQMTCATAAEYRHLEV